MPLKQERLLVPRCASRRSSRSQDAAGDATARRPWYLGTIEWNSRRLPVVSFEACGKRRQRRRSARARASWSFTPSAQELKGGYYGILTQGFPQLVRVNADVLGLETEQPPPDGSRRCAGRE